jgi:hypothetical protein
LLSEENIDWLKPSEQSLACGSQYDSLRKTSANEDRRRDIEHTSSPFKKESSLFSILSRKVGR